MTVRFTMRSESIRIIGCRLMEKIQMKPKIEKPIFDKDGYQINMKDLNGEPLPDPKNLVKVSPESIGLPSFAEMKKSPSKFIIHKRGGVREGAGRKQSGRHQIVLRLLPKAEKKLRTLAKKEHISLSVAAERLILQSI